MGYDRGESFSFDFEPNEIPFGPENRKENFHHDHIPFNLKGNGNMVFLVYVIYISCFEYVYPMRKLYFQFLSH